MKERIQINAEAIRLREQFGEDPFSPLDIFRLISGNEDLTIAFYPMSSRISGIAVRSKNARIIAINSTSTYGRQRFTAAHELYHLYYDNEFSVIVCHQEIGTARTDKEREADMFASYFLAPYEALRGFVEDSLRKTDGTLTVEDVVRIEQHFGLSRQATLVRLQSEGYLTSTVVDTMKTNIIASARKLGFDTSLYMVTPEDRQYATYGKYVALAELLREKELISEGKYEELLLDGFRGDIVFGTNLEEERYD